MTSFGCATDEPDEPTAELLEEVEDDPEEADSSLFFKSLIGLVN